jgi:nitrilase
MAETNWLIFNSAKDSSYGTILGVYLASPLDDQKGILYADLDMAEITRGKFDFDVIGHYTRPDIFQLRVNEAPNVPVDSKR